MSTKICMFALYTVCKIMWPHHWCKQQLTTTVCMRCGNQCPDIDYWEDPVQQFFDEIGVNDPKHSGDDNRQNKANDLCNIVTSLCMEGHFAIVMSYMCVLVYMKQPQVWAPYLTPLHSRDDDYPSSASVGLPNCRGMYLWETVKIMYLNRL